MIKRGVMLPDKQLLRLVGSALAIIAIIAGVNYAVDPLQLLHRPWFYPGAYSSDSRLQNAGLIQSQDFDTAFMGTSLAVHFRKSEIDRALGVRSVKLAMAGSTSIEQAFVLTHALSKRPKMVIWELDDWIFRNAAPLENNESFPADLYAMSVGGIAKYLLSLNTAKESGGILLRLVAPLKEVVHGLAALQIIKFYAQNVNDISILPDSQRSLYNRESLLKSFFHYRRFPDEISAGYDLPTMKRNFERDAISLIKDNPSVQFRIYFPPYSILQFVAMRDYKPATLDLVMKFTAYATQRLLEFSNVSVFDFRVAKEITHNLSNYLDLVHHSPEVDSTVLQLLATFQYEIYRYDQTEAVVSLQRQVSSYPSPNID
jgi:hypothetical protein